MNAAPQVPTAVPADANRLLWLDVVKGLAILAVLLHHFGEPGMGYRVLLAERGPVESWTRMWHISRVSTLNALDALLLFASGLGYQGVHVFLVVSGFVLGLSDQKRGAAPAFGPFLRRRAARLLPPYWLAVALLALIGAVKSLGHLHLAWLAGSSKTDALINVLLLRNFAEKWVWIYPGVWWFVPLIVQLYLLYPLLARAMNRNPRATLLGCALLTLAYRAGAVLLLNAKPVSILAGGASTPLLFCLARLWEFALGVFLASAWTSRAPRTVPLLLGGAILWGAGTVATTFRPGFIVAEPLIGTGLFALIYLLGRTLAASRWPRQVLSYCGRHSYALFLMHPMLLATPLVFHPGEWFVGKLLVFCLASCLLAAGLTGALTAIETLAANKRRPALGEAAS